MRKLFANVVVISMLCSTLCGCVKVNNTSPEVKEEVSQVTVEETVEQTVEEVEEEPVQESKPEIVKVSAKEQKELMDIVDAYCSMLHYSPGTYTPTAQNVSQYWSVIYYYKINGMDMEDNADMVDIYMEEWGVNQPYLRESKENIAHVSKAIFSDFSSVPAVGEETGVKEDGDSYLFMVGDRGVETIEMTGFEYQDDGNVIVSLDLYIEDEKSSSVVAHLIPNKNADENMEIPFHYAIESIEIKDAK